MSFNSSEFVGVFSGLGKQVEQAREVHLISTGNEWWRVLLSQEAYGIEMLGITCWTAGPCVRLPGALRCKLISSFLDLQLGIFLGLVIPALPDVSLFKKYFAYASLLQKKYTLPGEIQAGKNKTTQTAKPKHGQFHLLKTSLFNPLVCIFHTPSL